MGPETVVLLQATSVALAAWLCLPQLLNLFSGPRIENGFNGGPEEVIPHGLHDIDEELFQQLVALGFQPVGVYWEKGKLTRTFHEIVFSRRDAGFAMLYPRSQLGPRRAGFLTGFASGAVVFTKNYRGGMELEEDDLIAGAPGQPPEPASSPPDTEPRKSGFWAAIGFHIVAATVAGLASFTGFAEEPSPAWIFIGLGAYLVGVLRWHYLCQADKEARPATRDDSKDAEDFRVPLTEVLDEHRRRVASFVRTGHVPLAGTSPESYLEVQRLYHEHPVIRREFACAEKIILGAKLAFFAVLPALLAVALGPDHPAPWACLLLEGLTMALVRYGLSSARVLDLFRRLAGNA